MHYYNFATTLLMIAHCGRQQRIHRDVYKKNATKYNGANEAGAGLCLHHMAGMAGDLKEITGGKILAAVCREDYAGWWSLDLIKLLSEVVQSHTKKIVPSETFKPNLNLTLT